MKFHGKSMEFHEKFGGIPLNFMEFRGIPWNSMEFHGIPWKNIMKKKSVKCF
jgi:hypothetical protein